MEHTFLVNCRIIDPAAASVTEDGLLTLMHGDAAPDSIGYCGKRGAPGADDYEHPAGEGDHALSIEGGTLLPGFIDVSVQLFSEEDKSLPHKTLFAYRRAGEMLSRGIMSAAAEDDRYGVARALCACGMDYFLWTPMILLADESDCRPGYCLFRGLPEGGSAEEQRWLSQANKASVLGMKPVLATQGSPVCQPDGSLTLVRMAQLLTEGGFSPMEALQALTSNAAEVLGVSGRTGRLASGYEGDVLAVDGDPLSDPSALERCVMTARGGRLIKSSLPGLTKSNLNLLPPGYDF